MGTYLNPGPAMLRQGRRSRVYVDKSGLLAYLNSVLGTERKYVCVSRPRRFGKTMAANMVSAYYDRTVDRAAEFAGLAIADDPSFEMDAGAYDVLKVNMQDFLSAARSIDGLISLLQKHVAKELLRAYPDADASDYLPMLMADVFGQTERQFVIVIDEWDCVMRETRADAAGQKLYLDFLRAWLKDKPYVALCYMTGILPVKKYGSHSALNMFDEFSMVEPLEMAPYMGFTEAEVRELCREWGRDLDECKAWYDGYLLPGAGSVYSPRSVARAIESGYYGSYWTQTETFEALRRYIEMDLDGLHAKVVELMGGGQVSVDTRTYGNDMTTFSCADDVLTLLIHLGYLGYDASTCTAFIPNREVAGEYAAAVRPGGWDEVARSIKASEALLDALLAGRADEVAAGVERAHEDAASIIAYNDENTLACTLRLAFFSAVRRYRLVREAPAGKGYADLLMVPSAGTGSLPGVVVELKWGDSPEAAIAQIRERGYDRAFAGTPAEGNVVLAGICYDPKSKSHSCMITH